jgi:hypothetical protein
MPKRAEILFPFFLSGKYKNKKKKITLIMLCTEEAPARDDDVKDVYFESRANILIGIQEVIEK